MEDLTNGQQHGNDRFCLQIGIICLHSVIFVEDDILPDVLIYPKGASHQFWSEQKLYDWIGLG
jgi:hypothetical protein